MSNDKDYKLLIVDDEPLIRESLFEILRIQGYSVRIAATAEEALELMAQEPSDIILTDMKLPKMSGIELLEAVKEKYPQTGVILITGYGSIETAVDAMKKGAFDYITKPINDNEIKLTIRRIIQQHQLIAENTQLKTMIANEGRGSYGDMIGSSPKMQKIYHVIDSVASTNATILISGESGTGKGLIARAIHAADKTRQEKPFVEVSCGALSETLLESELFGHVKGSFTGAIKDKQGRFEYADGGTIFLDEIDAFSLSLQVKLLRVLQDGVYERVGDNVTRTSNARIIVATNKNLLDLIDREEFREDLYYRINVIAIQPPPLRERKEDIQLIVDYYLKKYSKANNKSISGLSDEVAQMFQAYDWPGNIRELENVIEGAVIMACDSIVEKDDIPHAAKFEGKETRSADEVLKEQSLKKFVEMPEKEHIITVLDSCNWNRNKAAAILGINRTTLYNKMKKYDILEKSSNNG